MKINSCFTVILILLTGSTWVAAGIPAVEDHVRSTTPTNEDGQALVLPSVPGYPPRDNSAVHRLQPGEEPPATPPSSADEARDDTSGRQATDLAEYALANLDMAGAQPYDAGVVNLAGRAHCAAEAVDATTLAYEEALQIDTPADGWYCLAVCKSGTSDLDLAGDYRLNVGSFPSTVDDGTPPGRPCPAGRTSHRPAPASSGRPRRWFF